MSVSKSDFERIYQDCETIEEWNTRSTPLINEIKMTSTELELDELSSWLRVMYQRLSLKQPVQHEFYKEVNSVKTSYCTIHMAGDYDTAVSHAREYTFNHGACFQITKCDYVYTGGKESGITARVLCYPRFPKTDRQLLDEAKEFAFGLAEKLCQKSFTIETSTDTIYFQSNKNLHGK
ncbi:hypothetical protein pEaSNUABM49_00175 [Erwinia phage pEa_SNUABM_49]|nr:hypothetical protein pEaSNUABM49_00175 [Erwinia phage pEa_SNUABM_49]